MSTNNILFYCGEIRNIDQKSAKLMLHLPPQKSNVYLRLGMSSPIVYTLS